MVTRLRRVLPPSGVKLLTVGAGYELVADPDAVDLHRTIRLARQARYEPSTTVAADLLDAAVSLWRRPVLGDYGGQRIQEFVLRTVGPDLALVLATYEDHAGSLFIPLTSAV